MGTQCNLKKLVTRGKVKKVVISNKKIFIFTISVMCIVFPESIFWNRTNDISIIIIQDFDVNVA